LVDGATIELQHGNICRTSADFDPPLPVNSGTSRRWSPGGEPRRVSQPRLPRQFPLRSMAMVSKDDSQFVAFKVNLIEDRGTLTGFNEEGNVGILPILTSRHRAERARSQIALDRIELIV
jgi:hypothetical protein